MSHPFAFAATTSSRAPNFERASRPKRRRNFWVSFVRRGGGTMISNPRSWKRILERIRHFYERSGYYGAEVRAGRVQQDGKFVDIEIVDPRRRPGARPLGVAPGTRGSVDELRPSGAGGDRYRKGRRLRTAPSRGIGQGDLYPARRHGVRLRRGHPGSGGRSRSASCRRDLSSRDRHSLQGRAGHVRRARRLARGGRAPNLRPEIGSSLRIDRARSGATRAGQLGGIRVGRGGARSLR